MAETNDDWPYDADRDDPLTALRIPVTSAYPEWTYIAVFDRESPERPTDAEAAMIASFIDEYKHHWYDSWFRDKILTRHLDVEARQITTVFHKRGPGQWAYRRVTWETGPFMIPPHGEPGLPLASLMDHVHTIGDEVMEHWTTWKAGHPDVFGAPPRPGAARRTRAARPGPAGSRGARPH